MNSLPFANRHAHKKPPRSKSGMKGVIYEPKGANGKPLSRPWKAYIRHHGIYITLGRFATEREAAAAYNAAALRCKREGTFLNPVPAAA